MTDFTDVMQLAEGISSYDLFPEKAPRAQSVKAAEAKKILLNPGIVPPRREIGQLLELVDCDSWILPFHKYLNVCRDDQRLLSK